MEASPLAWLYSTQWFGVKLGLDNMRRLLKEALANPKHGVKVLHVAGTNGKGSTCVIADSVARAHGVRTGLFTSPHLIDFRERIRVDGMMISQEELDQQLSYLRTLVAAWDPHPTFFELALAAALRYFKAKGCELIILETGMGGRLDATNAVPSDVTAITPIGLDHAEWLGDTMGKIAAEKAGIFKEGVPALSSAQEPEARQVLEEIANMVRSPLRFIEDPLAGYPLALAGQHQRHNAAIAVEALYTLGYPLRVDSVSFGLADVKWPGRFDRRPEHRLILDGAHNPHGAAVLATTWRDWFPREQAILIFSALTDKDPTAMLEVLRPIAGHLILCPVDSPRTRDTVSLDMAARAAGFLPENITLTANLSQALAAATQFSGTSLLTGSLYLVGEAIALLEGQERQKSAQ